MPNYIRTYKLSHDESRATCSIRTDTYESSFGHFIRLAEAVYADFPDKLKADIEVVIYGGDIKLVRGVEFKADTCDIPDSYELVQSLHPHI